MTYDAKLARENRLRQQLVAQTQPMVDRILDATGRDRLPADPDVEAVRRFVAPNSIGRTFAVGVEREARDQVLYRKRKDRLEKMSRVLSGVMEDLRGSDGAWLNSQINRSLLDFRRQDDPNFDDAALVIARLSEATAQAAALASGIAPLRAVEDERRMPGDPGPASQPLVLVIRDHIAPLYRKLMRLPADATVGTSNRHVANDECIDPFSEEAPEDGGNSQRPDGPAVRFAMAVLIEIGFLKSTGEAYQAGSIRKAFQEIRPR